VDLPGPVALGHRVKLGEGGAGAGVVVHFDTKKVSVAMLEQSQLKIGDAAELGGPVSVRVPDLPAQGVKFFSVEDLLVEDSSLPVLRVPEMPSPRRRRPVHTRLPCGLGVVESLLPLGSGHRVGLVGPSGTGKSTAARMMMHSQGSETVCIYVAQGPLPRLQSELGQGLRGGARLLVVHADTQDLPAVRLLAPMCAIHIASRLVEQDVLLVVDDTVSLIEVAADLGKRQFPASVPQMLAAALDGAGNVSGSTESASRSLSVVTVLDFAAEDELPWMVRELWRTVEPSLDVCLGFSGKLAMKGVLPAIEPDQLAACTFPPLYQAPLLRQLRELFTEKLRRSCALEQQVTLKRDLLLEVEVDETEELESAAVSRAMLSHASHQTLAELAVLVGASVVYHFPRRTSPVGIATFQRSLLSTIRQSHPVLWEALINLEALGDTDASAVLLDLWRTLLQHRQDFSLTRSA